MRKLLFASLAFMFIVSCSKKDTTPATPAPTVSFTYTKSSNTAPSNVQFTSTATNTTSYAWDFGDGSSSTTANPSHTYSSNGTFNVTLSVTGAGGSATTSSQVVLTAVVITPPTASFNYSGNGVAPSTVTFTNTSTNSTSYSWDFGDNNNNTSTSQNAQHTYYAGGVYTVTLTATGAGGTNSTTKTVNVTAPSVVKITNVKITKLPLTNSSGGSWDIGSGADVFIKILNGTTVLYDHPNYVQDVIATSLPLTFVLQNAAGTSTPLIINSADFALSKTISLYDYDSGSANDLMSSVTFKPSLHTTGTTAYPTTLALTNSSNDTNIILTLLWQ